jgi:hypothetical protein
VEWAGVEWIYLAEGRDEWLAVVNASSIVRGVRLAEEVSAPDEGLCFMKAVSH